MVKIAIKIDEGPSREVECSKNFSFRALHNVVNVPGHNSDSVAGVIFKKTPKSALYNNIIFLIKTPGLRHVSTTSCRPSSGSVNQHFL